MTFSIFLLILSDIYIISNKKQKLDFNLREDDVEDYNLISISPTAEYYPANRVQNLRHSKSFGNLSQYDSKFENDEETTVVSQTGEIVSNSSSLKSVESTSSSVRGPYKSYFKFDYGWFVPLDS